MKTLLLLRHAKSSWKVPGLPDIDRPLNKRGKNDAPRMGKLLKDHGLQPDLIVISSDKRAKKRAAKVAKKAGYDGLIEVTGELYLASPATYLRVLNRVSDDHQCVMVVGHNPGIEDLLALLTSEGDVMPTAALAHILLPIDHWNQLTPHTRGALEAMWRPKELDE
jgi:phosphohistidine phosphatase